MWIETKYRIVEKIDFYNQSEFICEYKKVFGFWRLMYYLDGGRIRKAEFKTLKEAENCILKHKELEFREKKIIHKK
jgi:hypothetical protein